MSAEDGEILRCAVCNDQTSGNHFGVTACRACAAFFRRSTVANRRYVCRFGGNCDIGKDIRCCCRACRIAKCYEVGMRTDLARGVKESPGKVKSVDSSDSSSTPPLMDTTPASGDVPISSNTVNIPLYQTFPVELLASSSVNVTAFDSNLPNVSTVFVTQPTTSVESDGRTFAVLESLPALPIPVAPSISAINPQSLDFSKPITYELLLGAAANVTKEFALNKSLDKMLNVNGDSGGSKLQRMVHGYRRLEILRRCNKNFPHSMDKVFSEKNPVLQEGNYADDMAAIKNDLPLASDLVNTFFDPIQSFNINVKWSLLRQFFCPFIMAERAFRTARIFPDLDDHRLLMGNEEYINFNNMEKFCDVPNCKIEPARLASIITPTFSKICTMLVNPMRRLQLTEEECVGLLGLLFWNDTLTTLTPSETEKVFAVQEELIVELYGACKRSAGTNKEAAARMGIVCNLVPLCVRLSNELSNCFSLVNMTNAFDFDHFLTTVMPQLV